MVAVYSVASEKTVGESDQETLPVYPVPAVVVVTGVSPVTGALTPAIGALEMTVSALHFA